MYDWETKLCCQNPNLLDYFFHQIIFPSLSQAIHLSISNNKFCLKLGLHVLFFKINKHLYFSLHISSNRFLIDKIWKLKGLHTGSNQG